MRYYNLAINKTGSNLATLSNNISTTNVLNNVTIIEGRLSNGTRTVTGNSGKAFTIQDGGTYVLTGTTTLPATFTRSFQSGSSIIYSSNSAQTVGVPSAGSYHNLVFEGSGTKRLAGNIVTTGNLNISSGTLDASTSNYNISLAGNWNNTGGTFNARNASVTFNGATAQSISSNTHGFYNVTFNNTTNGTSAIVLNDNVTIANNCSMTDGIINTGANMLELSNTAAANLSGFSSASYVYGNLRRYIASNTSTYAFPTGTSAYQRIDVKNNNMTGVTYIDGRFDVMARHDDADFAVEGINDGGANYLSLSLSGMWTIDPNSEPGGGTYDILAYTANMSGVFDNEFAVLKRATNAADGSFWNTGGGTINGSGGDGRMASDGYALRMGLASFSEFGIASHQPSNPLPVQLVSFNAKLSRTGTVNIAWVTATEINNDFFSVERSSNGINFEEIQVINGAGNANRNLNYQTIDGKPLTGVSYYRLAQTDYDGTKSYSNIVSINNAGVQTANTWSVFPNPVTIGGNVNIFGNTNALNKATVEIFEAASGRKVAFENINNETTKISIDRELNPGVYVVRITENETVQSQKLIVQ